MPPPPSRIPGAIGPNYAVREYENTYWGAESSNITADPNPRLQAYVAAAAPGQGAVSTRRLLRQSGC